MGVVQDLQSLGADVSSATPVAVFTAGPRTFHFCARSYLSLSGLSNSLDLATVVQTAELHGLDLARALHQVITVQLPEQNALHFILGGPFKEPKAFETPEAITGFALTAEFKVGHIMLCCRLVLYGSQRMEKLCKACCCAV